LPDPIQGVNVIKKGEKRDFDNAPESMDSTCDEEGSWLLPDVSTSAEVSRFWNSTWLSWEAVSRFWNSTWLSWEAGGGRWTDSEKAAAENSPALAGVLVATGTL
jgi:hypothetical protein